MPLTPQADMEESSLPPESSSKNVGAPHPAGFAQRAAVPQPTALGSSSSGSLGPQPAGGPVSHWAPQDPPIA